MIKVNLNKTKSSIIYNTQRTEENPANSLLSTVVSTALKGLKGQSMVDLNVSLIAKVLLNLVLILSFPLALKAYEINQINKIKKEKQQKEKLLASANDEFSNLESQLAAYDYLKDKAREFSEKKDFLKKLAESRLTIPRTIDLIQSKTPKTVWLESLKLELSEEGQQSVHISGQSFSEAHVNSFANSLHDVLDKNSITVNTHDIKDGDSVVKVNFSLQGVI